MKTMIRYLYIAILLLISVLGSSQPVPNVEENIPYLMTFGPKAETSWGDDDFSQAFFFLVPEEYTQPFFIRVFDPDTGGEIDEIAGVFNTRQVYEVYGGETAWSEPDARETSPDPENIRVVPSWLHVPLLKIRVTITAGTPLGPLIQHRENMWSNITVVFSRLYVKGLKVTTEICIAFF